MVSKLDEDNITDADFSVMLYGLPPETPKSAIREIILRTGVAERNLVYINMCYKVKKTLQNRKKQERYIKDLNIIAAYRARKEREGFTPEELAQMLPEK